VICTKSSNSLVIRHFISQFITLFITLFTKSKFISQFNFIFDLFNFYLCYFIYLISSHFETPLIYLFLSRSFGVEGTTIAKIIDTKKVLFTKKTQKLIIIFNPCGINPTTLYYYLELFYCRNYFYLVVSTPIRSLPFQVWFLLWFKVMKCLIDTCFVFWEMMYVIWILNVWIVVPMRVHLLGRKWCKWVRF